MFRFSFTPGAAFFALSVFALSLTMTLPLARASSINKDVAKAYNDGIVRCTNADCAKYLYACFRSYSRTSLQEFLNCGSQAAILNEEQQVVEPPASS